MPVLYAGKQISNIDIHLVMFWYLLRLIPARVATPSFDLGIAKINASMMSQYARSLGFIYMKMKEICL